MKFVNDLLEDAKKLEKLASQAKMGLWSKGELARQLQMINGLPSPKQERSCECGGELVRRYQSGYVYYKCANCKGIYDSRD